MQGKLRQLANGVLHRILHAIEEDELKSLPCIGRHILKELLDPFDAYGAQHLRPFFGR